MAYAGSSNASGSLTGTMKALFQRLFAQNHPRAFAQEVVERKCQLT